MSEEVLLPAWSLLLSQKQYFLNNRLAKVAVKPIQQGTVEMRNQLLLSVSTQGVDTKGIRYPTSRIMSLTGKILNWKWMQCSDYAVMILSHLPLYTGSELGSVAENPILTDEEGDNLLFQQLRFLRDQSTPLCWWEVVLLGRELKMFLIIFIEKCLKKLF